MCREAKEVDLPDVEREIAGGFRFLRFQTNIEHRFESDLGSGRSRKMIRLNLIGLLVYHAFLVGDYLTINDAFRIDLYMHFLVMTPVTLAINAVLSRPHPAWLREILVSFGILILATTIFIVVSYSKMPDRDVVSSSQILVILFSTVMLQIRIRYVITICLIIQAFYSCSLATMASLSSERIVMLNFVFFGIALFSIVGSYHLEYEQRMRYLLCLRDLFKNKQLEELSLQDALTGISNRRALDLALIKVQDNKKRTSFDETAIVLIDIDHFKQFNDTNGHQQGDACLRRVAGIIEGSLRDDDQTAYRFGGEEFLVLLRDTTFEEAQIVAERIRVNVEKAEIVRGPNNQGIVTVSVGVAIACVGQDSTSSALIAHADDALYTAKRQGRNRVTAANTNLPKVLNLGLNLDF